MSNFIKRELADWSLPEALWLLVADITILVVSVLLDDTPMGMLSASTGVICVVLTSKGKISAYAFGLANAVLYSVISYKAGLYGETMLNTLYYVPMQFVGFYLWNKHMDVAEVKTQRMSLYGALSTGCLTGFAVLVYGYLLHRLGDPQPLVDSFTTVLSVTAMLLSARRYTEQWFLWIAVDVASVYMWYRAYSVGNENAATLAMWCVYLVNAVYGLCTWMRKSKRTRQ